MGESGALLEYSESLLFEDSSMETVAEARSAWVASLDGGGSGFTISRALFNTCVTLKSGQASCNGTVRLASILLRSCCSRRARSIRSRCRASSARTRSSDLVNSTGLIADAGFVVAVAVEDDDAATWGVAVPGWTLNGADALVFLSSSFRTTCSGACSSGAVVAAVVVEAVV